MLSSNQELVELTECFSGTLCSVRSPRLMARPALKAPTVQFGSSCLAGRKLLLFAEQLLSNGVFFGGWGDLKAVYLLFVVEWIDTMLAVLLTG